MRLCGPKHLTARQGDHMRKTIQVFNAENVNSRRYKKHKNSNSLWPKGGRDCDNLKGKTY